MVEESTSGATAFQALTDTIVDGVVVIDRNGGIQAFNPACERLFGYQSNEVMGKNVSMLMPEPYHSEHDGYLNHYRTTGEKKIIGIGREVVGLRKNNSTFPMELSVGETRHGGEIANVGIIRDITERKEAEQRLRDGETRLRAVIDTMNDGVIMIDAHGIVRLFNPAAEWIFRYRAREVLGQNVKILMPAPYQGEHDGYLRHYRRTGERKIIGIGREVVGQRKDGSQFPMELSVGETTASGEPLFVGVVRDITEAKRSEALLGASENRYQQLVNSLAGYAIFSLDPTGVVTSWNTGAERILGYTEAEAMGLNFATFNVDTDITQKILDTLLTTGLFEGELQYKRKDGSLVNIHVVMNPIADPKTGKPIGIAKVVRSLEPRQTETGIQGNAS